MKKLFVYFALSLVVITANAQSCPDNNHPHMIDLGLPSATKWACCNVGASKPEECGSFYAWGETETKAVYNENTYKYYENGNYVSLGSDITGTKYDVAHVKWGKTCQMPTLDQQKELANNCSYKWTMENGVVGFKFTSKMNGASIFLPAAGIRHDSHPSGSGSDCCYWSSTQYSSYPDRAVILYFKNRTLKHAHALRGHGRSVRPVSCGTSVAQQMQATSTSSQFKPSPQQSSRTASFSLCPDGSHPHIIDLGLPSGTLWACCNVGASKPESSGGRYAWGRLRRRAYTT